MAENYTREQLLEALRHADTTGDDAAARVIAGRIQSLDDAGHSYVADFARRAANTFGVADKMIAQGRATLPMMYPWMFGQDVSVVNPGGAYDPATQEARATKNLEEERAKTAAAGEHLGPVGSAIADITGYLPLAAVTGGAGLGPIATSAIGGGLAGAGHSTATDPGGIAQDAATSAAINAATAGVITKGGPYGPALAKRAITQYAPRAAGGFLGSYFGPVGTWIGSELAKEFTPAVTAPLTPSTSASWLTPWINKAAQGVLSGQGL